MGQAKNKEDALRLVGKYANNEQIEHAFKQVITHWDDILGTIKVKTPDDTTNCLLNRWPLYQTISCRLLSRSAFYQSGGAYGFRDQLQDVMALVHTLPKVAKDHILKASSRQFEEGDVQHWWHPPTGRGVRTRFSDDLLWLPYVTSFYVKATSDYSLLYEETYFIKGPKLEENQDDQYFKPDKSSIKASVYEHCKKAINRSLSFGEHNLPLMGSGDWNDGMSLVGPKGKGESVWLAQFLYKILGDFLDISEIMKDKDFSLVCKINREKLKTSVNKHAWDGNWYRSAYMDDGHILGSKQNDECRIDSTCQTWSVISEIAPKDRAYRAMESFEEYLVQKEENLIKLLTPPFDKSSINPGYIKGYVPGVRENGGQYTHAATWAIEANTKLGRGDKAYELFCILNPINHSNNRAGLLKYKVEPYVIAADIYALSPYIGRGGWTWYTGSSGLLYRTGIEAILGLKLFNNNLRLSPCIPSEWRSYQVEYKYKSSILKIEILNPDHLSTGDIQINMDGHLLEDNLIPLSDDNKEHNITAYIRPFFNDSIQDTEVENHINIL